MVAAGPPAHYCASGISTYRGREGIISNLNDSACLSAAHLDLAFLTKLLVRKAPTLDATRTAHCLDTSPGVQVSHEGLYGMHTRREDRSKGRGGPLGSGYFPCATPSF